MTLKFKQKRITVHISQDGRSRAGNKSLPMELPMFWKTTENAGLTLIHELGHRLIIGNGIEPSLKTKHAEDRYNYLVHRQLYLFLYDVYLDVFNNKVANDEVKRESIPDTKQHYMKAWQWAMKKNYNHQQEAFKRIKRYYLK